MLFLCYSNKLFIGIQIWITKSVFLYTHFIRKMIESIFTTALIQDIAEMRHLLRFKAVRFDLHAL